MSTPPPATEEKQSSDGSDGGIAMGRTLATFWTGLNNAVKQSPSGHALRDIAWLELLSGAEKVPDVPEEKVNLQCKHFLLNR